MNHLQYKILNYLYEETGSPRMDIREFCKEQYEHLKIFSGSVETKSFTLTVEEFEMIIT